MCFVWSFELETVQVSFWCVNVINDRFQVDELFLNV